jgi:hypothetical protein
MFKLLFKKERQVQELIFRYLDNLKKTQEHFEQAMLVVTYSDFSSQSTLFPIILKRFSS